MRAGAGAGQVQLAVCSSIVVVPLTAPAIGAISAPHWGGWGLGLVSVAPHLAPNVGTVHP